MKKYSPRSPVFFSVVSSICIPCLAAAFLSTAFCGEPTDSPGVPLSPTPESGSYPSVQMGLVCSGGACRPQNPAPRANAPQSGVPQSIIPPVRVPRCQVRLAVSSQRVSSFGSGTIIRFRNRILILSCAHVFEDIDNGAAISVPTLNLPQSDGATAYSSRPIRLLGRDKIYDLAVLDASLTAADLGSFEAIDLLAAPPLPGESATACGFGPNGTYQQTPAVVAGYVKSGKTPTFDTLRANYSAARQTVRFGDSGGGIFNQNGELIAVLWGSDAQALYATQIGRVLFFLNETIPNAPEFPDPPSVCPPPTNVPGSQYAPYSNPNSAPDPAAPYQSSAPAFVYRLFSILQWLILVTLCAIMVRESLQKRPAQEQKYSYTSNK